VTVVKVFFASIKAANKWMMCTVLECDSSEGFFASIKASNKWMMCTVLECDSSEDFCC
jgi:hypothetical protein